MRILFPASDSYVLTWSFLGVLLGWEEREKAGEGELSGLWTLNLWDQGRTLMTSFTSL